MTGRGARVSLAQATLLFEKEVKIHARHRAFSQEDMVNLGKDTSRRLDYVSRLHESLNYEEYKMTTRDVIIAADAYVTGFKNRGAAYLEEPSVLPTAPEALGTISTPTD